MAFFSVLRSSPMAVSATASSSSRSLPPPFSRSFSHAASVLRITSSKRRASFRAATSLSVRCEQSANQVGGGGADVWVGRLAMVSVTAAITAEVSTGKGLLENLGVATPAPALALIVTALVVGVVVLFILQSGSRD